MDKLRMQSLDKTKCNVEKLKELFPNAVTEVKGADGKIDYAIDFDVLKQELSSEIVEGREERYQFTWPGKRDAILLANSPITKTLRPCKEESVDFDNTQNLYIEGDNLEVLKLLQETYLHSVDIIYIDPPYNTGNDFIYNDDFAQSQELFDELTGIRDEEGNRLFQNTPSNGRFHSDWCSMIYPRLKLAKDLLSEDGIIFISIDDNEVTNLKKVCDEIFGEDNFLNYIVWNKNSTTVMLNKEGFSTNTEYILLYKSKNAVKLKNNAISERLAGSYNKDDNDGRGKYRTVNLYTNTNTNKRVSLKMPDGTFFEAKWQVTQETFDDYVKQGLIVKTPSGWRKKIYLSNCEGSVPVTMLDPEIVGTTKTGTGEIQSLFDGKTPFPYPKPTTLVKYLIGRYPKNDVIVLDFFSGSSTTAHAVMQLNAEDGGHRKFIMVQFPEKCDEGSEAAKAGFKTICEIGKERIRRAGKKILKENPSARGSSDVGFRVLKLDSSNMEDIYYDPASTKQGELSIVNVKTDRTSLDLLFQTMLEFDKPLSSKIEETKICGKTVFKVDGDDLICCFDEDISDELVTEIAKLKPLYAVFRDSSFNGDSVRANCGQIFTKFSPATSCRVI